MSKPIHFQRPFRSILCSAPLLLMASFALAGWGCSAPLKKDRMAWRYAYDRDGRLSQIQDPAGRRTRFDYELGPGPAASQQPRRIQVTLGDGNSALYEYDEHGLLRTSRNATTVNRYEYDAHGQLAFAQRGSLPAVKYFRDAEGRLAQLQVAGWSLSYRYDYRGRLTEIGTPAGTIRYEYGAAQGLVVRTLPSGVRSIYQQRPSGELESIVHATADRRILARFQYEYRPDGLLAAAAELTADGETSLRYQYDLMHRLTRVEDSRRGSETYIYDPLGNRLVAQRTGGPPVESVYDWAGRLIRHRESPAESDAVGNLRAYEHPAGPIRFNYTAASELSSVELASGRVSYTYDADSRLATRQAGPHRVEYVVDAVARGFRPLLTRDERGHQTLYVWDGPLLLLTLEAPGEPRYYLHDRLGSIRAVVGVSSTVLEERSYSPFGEPTVGALSAAVEPSFAGLLYDTQTGLYLGGGARLRAAAWAIPAA